MFWLTLLPLFPRVCHSFLPLRSRMPFPIHDMKRISGSLLRHSHTGDSWADTRKMRFQMPFPRWKCLVKDYKTIIFIMQWKYFIWVILISYHFSVPWKRTLYHCPNVRYSDLVGLSEYSNHQGSSQRCWCWGNKGGCPEVWGLEECEMQYSSIKEEFLVAARLPGRCLTSTFIQWQWGFLLLLTMGDLGRDRSGHTHLPHQNKHRWAA